MAELREFDPVETVTEDITSSVRRDVLAQPREHLKKISRFEKIVFFALISFFLLISGATIQVSSKLAKAEATVSEGQAAISKQEASIAELEQEKSELLRADRIKKAAQKAGLKVNEEQIRNVK
ncbi:cell division protein FtsL [Vagococcus lutrae]|uniref:cell division protein FtsL n=1 Tax=Vagococcus lutrae TaxID=81947 RepID=UPI002891C486|nr:cell division protein FtsL [Vagococcus lutrae]MDT2841521.1 cell division protein FtsL [Vagococcus lutrae]